MRVKAFLLVTVCHLSLWSQSRIVPGGTFRLSTRAAEHGRFLAAGSNGRQFIVAVSSPRGSRVTTYSSDLRRISTTEIDAVVRRIWLLSDGHFMAGELIGGKFHFCAYFTNGQRASNCLPADDPFSEIWMGSDGIFSLGRMILKASVGDSSSWQPHVGRVLNDRDQGLIRSAVAGDSLIRVATRTAKGAILDRKSGREREVDLAEEAGYANQRLTLNPNQQLISQLVSVAEPRRFLAARATWHPSEGLPLDVFETTGKHLGIIRLDTTTVDLAASTLSASPNEFVPTVILAAGSRVFGVDTRFPLGAWYEITLP